MLDFISNTLTKILTLDPSLTSQEAIQKLYTQHSVSDPQLAIAVANGQRLKLKQPIPMSALVLQCRSVFN